MADLSRLKALLESGVTSAKGAYDSLQKQAAEANKGLIQNNANMLTQVGYSPEDAQARAKNINDLSQSAAMGSISGVGSAALEGALAKNVAAKALTPAAEVEGILGPEVMSRFKVRAPMLNAEAPVQQVRDIPFSKLQEVFQARKYANMLPEADAALIKSAENEAKQQALLDGIREQLKGK